MAGTTFSSANWTGYDEQSLTNPGSALTDFTLLIDIANLSSSFDSNVQSDGADIRITKGDGTTELAYDLIDWAYNAGAPTGLIRVKWSGTMAASGTQNVRVWAGYTGGTAVAYDANDVSGFGSDNAYDTNWAGYWPLHDLNDRTSNGNDLTAYNAPTSGATGKIGQCYSFDNSSLQYLEKSGAVITTPPYTMLAWFYLDSYTGGSISLVGVGTSANPCVNIYHKDTTTDHVGAQSFNGTSFPRDEQTLSTSLATWYHCAGRWESNSSREVALDGVFTGTPQTTTVSVTGINTTAIGRLPARSFYYMDGRIDDVQIHSTARSDDWISHEYDQTSDNATFWGTWSWTTAGGGPDYTLTAASGSFTLTGQDASLLHNRRLTADSGSFAITGNDAGLLFNRRLTAESGTFTLTGQDADLLFHRVLAADSGSYTLTGYDATLTYTPAGGPDYTLTAESGTFALTGQDVALLASRRLTAESGAFTLTGYDVGLSPVRIMVAETGTFTLTGQDCSLLRGLVLQCTAGDFSLTGNPVTLTYSGAETTVPDGVDYRATDGRPHYRALDGRPHYKA